MHKTTPGQSLDEVIRELPPELKEEVKDFARFLLQTKGRKRAKPLAQGWAGALREYRNQYTSLELQRKAGEWRGD